MAMKLKRYRKVEAKDGQLRIKYGRDDTGELGLVIARGVGCDSADSWLIHSALFSQRCQPNLSNLATAKGLFDYIMWEPSIMKELDRRGYDTDTLTLSIQKKVSS